MLSGGFPLTFALLIFFLSLDIIFLPDAFFFEEEMALVDVLPLLGPTPGIPRCPS